MKKSAIVLMIVLVSLSFRGTSSSASTTAPKAPAKRSLSSFDPQVNQLLAQMTLEEKVGQMTQAEQSALKDINDIQKYHLGSLLSGGDSDPKAGNSVQAWTDMYDQLQKHALQTRLAIPILFGIDAVHGHNNVLGATIFPHNIGLGCTRDAKLVEQAARVTAEEVRATGINWAFAPCVTVPRDERWGRTYEGFGETPELARTLGEAAVRGFQGNDLSSPLSVVACAKHYVGDGGTTYGTGRPKEDGTRFPLDQGDTRLSEAELRAIHMQGYVTAIKAGVGTIMPSYSSWNGVKCSGSHRLLTEILKNELGFEGFLISDYNALDDLPGDRKSQIETSINAGMDMVMVPTRYVEFFTTLRDLVKAERVPMSRIDDAVRRILRVKFAMGLMDK
ncbi:MAG TPA: glycoside hydrolase family 3 protein, partial [Blastocatellia bacterium]